MGRHRGLPLLSSNTLPPAFPGGPYRLESTLVTVSRRWLMRKGFSI
jgi:hypothetical protein